MHSYGSGPQHEFRPAQGTSFSLSGCQIIIYIPIRTYTNSTKKNLLLSSQVEKF